jgi:hypothetical protein
MTEANIPEAERVRLDELESHPRNYRSHPQDQLDHIKASITEHGFYRNVVISRDGVVLAGHGVVEASKQLGLEEVSAVRLDIDSDDPAALRVMTGDNAIGGLAADDDRALAEILRELSDVGDLLGTGFDKNMLATLAMVTRPASEIADFDEAAEWANMPDYEPQDKKILMQIQFDDEKARLDFANMIGSGAPVRRQGTTWSLRWPLRDESEKQEDLNSVMFDDAGNVEPHDLNEPGVTDDEMEDLLA